MKTKNTIRSSRAGLDNRMYKWLAVGLLSHTLMASTSVANVKQSTFDWNLVEQQQVIIKFKDNRLQKSATAQVMKNSVAHLSQQINVPLNWQRQMASGAQLIKLEADQSMSDVLKSLQKLPNVEYAVANRRLHTMATPNDPRYNEQWHYFEATGGINMPAAWDINQGSGAVIAVVDTGYRPHADLVANILPGYDFISNAGTARDNDGRDNDASDEGDWFGFFECPGAPFFSQNSSWHGTHVAGTVAAVNDNSEGVAGIAPQAKVVPVRVLGKCGGTLDDIQDGMLWAAGISVPGVPDNPNPADVINLSLGGGAACDAAMQDVVNQITAAGTTVVAAAGNSNADAGSFTPASCNNVLTVASTNRSGARASYSNFGSVVEIAAPGGETSGGAANGVLSTLNTGTQGPEADSYSFYQGTSMAAPHAAGVVGLLYSHKPDITPAQVQQTLMDTARAFPGTCNQCGAGIIDAAAALQALGGGSNQAPDAGFSFAVSGFDVNFTDSSSDSDGSVVSWSWSFGDGNSSTSQNPAHTYAAAGSYTVTLTVTDNEGATDSASQAVTISDGSNEPPKADFTFAATDLDVSFTDASSDVDGNVVAWSWDFGDGNTSSSQNPSHSYAAEGNYTVTLTVTDDDGAQASVSQDVRVSAPVVSIDLSASVTSLFFFKNISLSWSGATGANVDLYVGGSLSGSTANDGSWSEWRIGSGSETYQVCETGTSNCSDEITVNY
ncbi:S8 family serine peptidase [Pleionea sp. CnH1-48]|uniref:S8 family serine peptidase n=1 Tax=Pleionea sp. CnH1-48 TaxID=2954494 RepID=UPI0020972F32|nr:S8 family serine peptidase [Pleionea sp. CnH1-48]MCO7224141.1 S8 family serine peptidase [Pleionea sp. CnH1-48]